MADLNTWCAALMAAYDKLPERQKLAVLEAKCAFYAGLPSQIPADLSDEAAELMVEVLKFSLASRPRKDSH